MMQLIQKTPVEEAIKACEEALQKSLAETAKIQAALNALRFSGAHLQGGAIGGGAQGVFGGSAAQQQAQ